MQFDYAIEGYWLAKRRDLSINTVNDYSLTLRRFTEFVGKTRDLKDVTSDDVNRFLNHLRDDLNHSQKTCGSLICRVKIPIQAWPAYGLWLG